MINKTEIRYGVLISDEAFLSDDNNESNPVEVFFYDNHFWALPKNGGDARAFSLTDTLANIEKEYKHEILTATLGSYNKKDSVELRDVFLHGGYIQEINLTDYQLRFEIGCIFDKNGEVILTAPTVNKEVMNNVVYIFQHSLSLDVVDSYLFESDKVALSHRGIIIDALTSHLDSIQNNLLVHATINQLEADFDCQDYESMDELIIKLIDIPQAKELLVGYLSDTALENWKINKTVKRY